MTVEERARELMDRWRRYWPTGVSEDVFRGWVAQTLRDQIEDCAQIAKDREAEIANMLEGYAYASYVYNRGVAQMDECTLIEDRIRALAGDEE